MTDKQINTAIAEACGITSVDQWGVWYKTPLGWMRDCPDYCNDLNAMHEAEKVLTEGNWKSSLHATNRYTNELCKILGCLDTALFQFAHATASQRAEAFLITIGKWEEVQP